MHISENIRVEEEKIIRNEVVNIKMTLIFKVGEPPFGTSLITVTNDELKQETTVSLTLQWGRSNALMLKHAELVKQFLEAIIEKIRATAKFKLVD